MSRGRPGGGLLLFLAAALIVALIVWSRLRIVILVPLHIGGFVLFVLGLVVVVYLLLRFLLDR